MAYKVPIKPLTVRVELAFAPDEYVIGKQATTNDLIRLGSVFSQQSQVWKDGDVGTVRLEKEWNPEQLTRERVFSTLVGCSLKWETEDDSEVYVFRFKEDKITGMPYLDMTKPQFESAWGKLPAEVSEAIYEAILAANPQWKSNYAGESKAT